ncbi:hypothetical protein [Methylobacter tundripaludum]|uniref:hypothetical protein n=1 Tax=Methylobacter tundripaludum TaxID=173365 RepID=UPI000CEB2F28|nr:hypothetical protein [Methylobacter tundripaludum]
MFAGVNNTAKQKQRHVLHVDLPGSGTGQDVEKPTIGALKAVLRQRGLAAVVGERAIPAMKEQQACNRWPNAAGAARSYRIIVLNFMPLNCISKLSSKLNRFVI